jgi:Flp pilus assembly pilin Flp
MRIASFSATRAAWFYGLRRFADDAGATLLEYALVMALVSVVAVAGLSLLGSHANTTLSSAAASLGS